VFFEDARRQLLGALLGLALILAGARVNYPAVLRIKIGLLGLPAAPRVSRNWKFLGFDSMGQD
jgi:hypothetical protein